MKEMLESLFVKNFSKDTLVSFIKNDSKKIEEAYKIALTNNQPQAWRAAWILNHVIKNNDESFIIKVDPILKVLLDCKDGHQREWLKVLEKLKLLENQKSELFDICIEIWSDIFKRPGTRITAFRFLVKLVKKYPELKNEIVPLTQSHFTNSLSPGIKNSFKEFEQQLKINGLV